MKPNAKLKKRNPRLKNYISLFDLERNDRREERNWEIKGINMLNK